jgi:hypothetical protein
MAIDKIITRSDLLHTVVITVKDLENGAVEIKATPNLFEIAQRAVLQGKPPTMAEAYAMRILRAASELHHQISHNKGQPITLSKEALEAYFRKHGRSSN